MMPYPKMLPVIAGLMIAQPVLSQESSLPPGLYQCKRIDAAGWENGPDYPDGKPMQFTGERVWYFVPTAHQLAVGGRPKVIGEKEMQEIADRNGVPLPEEKAIKPPKSSRFMNAMRGISEDLRQSAYAPMPQYYSAPVTNLRPASGLQQPYMDQGFISVPGSFGSYRRMGNNYTFSGPMFGGY